MKELKIDSNLFAMAFVGDKYPVHPPKTYLNLEKGEVEWVWDNDDEAYFDLGIKPSENAGKREMIKNSPEKFLDIPSLAHDIHYDIYQDVLQEFLNSEWTENKVRWVNALNSYDGSIGRWMRSVDDQDAIYSYKAFREGKVIEMAEEYLKKHNVQPKWI